MVDLRRDNGDVQVRLLRLSSRICVEGGTRARSSSVTNDIERDNLKARWEVAHDICSLAACRQAFEDCKEGETYDLGEALPSQHIIIALILIQKLYGLL
jgi:hypothetical protein